MDTEVVARFIASGEQACFRSPYERSDASTIGDLVGDLSELAKAHFLLACIRHAWRTHVHYDIGTPIAEEVIELLGDLLDGRPIPLAGFHGQIERLHRALHGVKERARAGDSAAIPPTNVAYVLSALTTWLYRALGALSDDHGLTWFTYVSDTNAWLPFWLVLDGAASVGGIAERVWQEEAVRGFA